jgi:transposase
MRYAHVTLWGIAAYSIDLWQKIIHACERQLGSQRALADLSGVSLSFVEKRLRRHRRPGDIAPKPHAGGQRPALDAADALVLRLVHENTNIA